MIPWQRYMAAAFGVLRLSPRDFWAMTPVEFWAAFDGHIDSLGGDEAAGQPPSRAEVAELMARFPDPLPEAAVPPLRRVD